jgi:hypothetical protein
VESNDAGSVTTPAGAQPDPCGHRAAEDEATTFWREAWNVPDDYCPTCADSELGSSGARPRLGRS